MCYLYKEVRKNKLLVEVDNTKTQMRGDMISNEGGMSRINYHVLAPSLYTARLPEQDNDLYIG